VSLARQLFRGLVIPAGVIPAGGDTTELEIVLLSTSEFFHLAAVIG
jgi:hypothetical protein